MVTNAANEVLLLWRHRFITDTWGYEIPIGGIDPGEEPVEAAARECEEETGWRPGPLTPLLYVQPSNGLINAEHHVFYADHAEERGLPADSFEAEQVVWVPVERIPTLVAQRLIVGGTTAAALLLLFALRVGGDGWPRTIALPAPDKAQRMREVLSEAGYEPSADGVARMRARLDRRAGDRPGGGVTD